MPVPKFSTFSRLLSLLLIVGALLAGCEDDPILSPGNDDTPAHGSYGRVDKVGLYPPAEASPSEVTANPDENPALF